jgi:hypothetical protein
MKTHGCSVSSNKSIQRTRCRITLIGNVKVQGKGSMQIFKVIFACLLLTAVCFGKFAAAKSQSESEANRCSDAVVKRLGTHFHLTNFTYPAQNMYPNSENGGLLVAGICKPWPINKSRIIAAFAYDGGVKYEKQLLLAIVEVPSNRIIASYKGVKRLTVN